MTFSEEITEKKQPQSSSAQKDQRGPTGGWRSLTPAELLAVQKLNNRNDRGERTFQTYDLSHVALNTCHKTGSGGPANNGGKGIIRNNQSTGQNAVPLRTVFSMDSTTSKDERLNPKSQDQMANDTARLFCCSELSLKDKAKKEERTEAERLERLRKEEIAQQERERAVRERERETGLLDDSRSSRRGSSRKFLKPKIFRTMSKAFSDGTSDLSNLEASWRGGSASSRHRSGSTSGSGGGPKYVRRGSMQALTIDKARDLVDDSDDEGSVVGDEDVSVHF